MDTNTFVRVVLCFPLFLSTVRANSTQFPKSSASIFVFFFFSLFQSNIFCTFYPNSSLPPTYPPHLHMPIIALAWTLTLLHFSFCTGSLTQCSGLREFSAASLGPHLERVLMPHWNRLKWGGSSRGHDAFLLGALRPLSGVLSDLLPYRLAWSPATHN